jgi:hypothetical protein
MLYLRHLSVCVIAETSLPAPWRRALIRDLLIEWLVDLLYSHPNIPHRLFCNRWNYFKNPGMAQKLPAVIQNV